MVSRSLSVSILCEVAFLGLISQAQAVTIEENFPFNFRGKEWCPSNSNPAQGQFENFNETNTKTHIGAGITIKRDPLSNNVFTDLQAKLSLLPNASPDTLPPDLLAITMDGLGFLANKSGNSAEFVLHGVSGTDSNVFFTMRGKATLDTKTLINGQPAIKTASGKWIGSTQNTDDNGTPIPNQYCFADGTFQTGKKIVPAP